MYERIKRIPVSTLDAKGWWTNLKLYGVPCFDTAWEYIKPVFDAAFDKAQPLDADALSQVVTVAEAVGLTGMSQTTVDRWLHSRLVARKSGGVWLILRSSLPQP